MKPEGAFSIVIPVYNESLLLESEIARLVKALDNHHAYEIILVENGSRDNTYEIARQLAHAYPAVKVYRQTRPGYGKALQTGIYHSRYPLVIQFDLDLIDIQFLRTAITMLRQEADIVVGSKLHKDSVDRRPTARLLITRVLTFFIHALFAYPGTDTHGVKAYKKKAVVSYFKELPPYNHFFDTALLLCAHRQGLRIAEVPVRVDSLRSSRFPMKVRAWEAIGEFITLYRQRSRLSPRMNLTFTADDYGLTSRMDRSIERLSRYKKLRNISVLATHAKISDVARLPQGVRLSLHVNLVEGKPVLPPSSVPSLVNRNGSFYPLPLFYARLILGLVRKEEMEREIEAQISKLSRCRRKIYELNSHQHTHALAPVGNLCLQLARKWRIPHVRRYSNIRIFSLRGFINYAILGAARLPFPTRERMKSCRDAVSFMSWETSMHDNGAGQPLECVIHPGSLFDKNSTFKSYLT